MDADAAPAITYKDIRDKVRDGDIAFFSGDTLIAKAIQRVTRSPWSHVGLLFWDGEMLMLHEAVAEGCRAIRMSAKIETCTKPVVVARNRWLDSEAKRHAIRGASNYNLAVEYGWWQLVQIYFRVRLGIGRRPKWDHELICSELVAKAYAAGGYDFVGDYEGFVSPADLHRDPCMTEIGTIEPDPKGVA